MGNKPENTKRINSLETWSYLNNNLDLGDGVTASIISHKDKNDVNGTTNLFYTNKAPKLEVRGQKIDIEYSSTEQEDQDLLHFLANKIS